MHLKYLAYHIFLWCETNLFGFVVFILGLLMLYWFRDTTSQ